MSTHFNSDSRHLRAYSDSAGKDSVFPSSREARDRELIRYTQEESLDVQSYAKSFETRFLLDGSNFELRLILLLLEENASRALLQLREKNMIMMLRSSSNHSSLCSNVSKTCLSLEILFDIRHKAIFLRTTKKQGRVSERLEKDRAIRNASIFTG